MVLVVTKAGMWRRVCDLFSQIFSFLYAGESRGFLVSVCVLEFFGSYSALTLPRS
jgi:hypothetical protein